MNTIKRLLGIVWFVAGVTLALLLPYHTIVKLTSPTATKEDYVFWIVVATIFTPIIFGFILFGLYAVKGEYSED